MPQHSKENILAGRKAVDAYREAHAKLHNKPWHRGIPEEHTPLLDKLRANLKGLGFDSLDGFFDANDELNHQIMNECYRLEGICDGCLDREAGCEPACFQREKVWNEALKRYILPPEVTTLEQVLEYYILKYGQPDSEGKVIPNCKLRLKIVKQPRIDWRWH